MTQLTEHFTLEEFVYSDTAIAKGIDNTPSEAIIANLTLVARTLEEVRKALADTPITISSGYRCEALNKAVGGSMGSAHMKGLAADFISSQFTPLEICEIIAYDTDIMYDQLIHEHTWIHLGLILSGAPRKQNLTLLAGGGYADGFIS